MILEIRMSENRIVREVQGKRTRGHPKMMGKAISIGKNQTC